MGIFTNLFGYRRKRLYDHTKSRKDSRLNGGYDYDSLAPGDMIGRSLSGHILRNETMQHFVTFLDDALKNILKGVRYLNKYKNYTVKKDDKLTR